MKRNRRQSTKRIIAGFLSVILVISVIFPIFPVKAVENNATVYLSTPEDFIQLSENCVYDVYADEKRVVLKNDLDMTGYEIKPLAIFGGTFEGNNYTIKGLNFTEIGSNKGVFGIIKESGVVSNLNIEVFVEPTGSRVNIGGIAGENRGKLYNCTVSGTIKGEEAVGGIVGNNTQTGLISGCTNRAKVTGNQYTGGIAGKNYGAVFHCTNYGTVNEEENSAAQNTGGIAGISYGEIEQSTNEAAIGYLHTGYNVGGIVGRQNGHVIDCINHGTIYGRKDVGGIVGQFEPYTTIVYEEDIFQEMERKISETTERMNKVLEEAEVALKEITDCAETIENKVVSLSDAAADTLDNVNQEITDLSNQAQDVMNNLNTKITEITDELFYTIDRVDEIVDDAKDMSEQLQDIIDEVDRIVTDAKKQYKEFKRTINDITDKIDNIMIKIEDYKKKIEGIINSLPTIPDISELPSVELPTIPDIELPSVELPTLPDIELPTSLIPETESTLSETETTTVLPEISSDIEDITILEEEMTKTQQKETGIEETQTEAATEMPIETTTSLENNSAAISPISTPKVGIGLDNLNIFTDPENTDTRVDLKEKEENKTEKNTLIEEKVVDASAEQNSYDVSLIGNCKNTGEVSADGNVGGIAGIVAQEVGNNPEEDISFVGKESLKSTAYIKANIEYCMNEGKITAKNSYAGGIVGRADMGTLRNDKNTGTIETTNGNFNGGIAGSSEGLITACYTISDLTGNNDIGGIAGKAYDIDHCYSMVRIAAEGERVGAIAGSVSGTANQNFFVKEELQGVNGINYDGSAMPMNYQDFISIENLPDEFKKLKVSFYADDILIKTIYVDYKAKIKKEDIPAIPDKDGLFARWEEFDHSRIIRNIDVNAIYSDWTSTIATEGEQARLLLEGEFHPDTTIILTGIAQNQLNIQIPENYTLEEAYSFSIQSPIEHRNNSIKVRILSEVPEQEAKIGLITEEGFTLSTCEKDGSYLVFEMEKEGEFLILKKKTNIFPMVLGIGAGVIGIFLIFQILYRKKRKQNNKN